MRLSRCYGTATWREKENEKKKKKSLNDYITSTHSQDHDNGHTLKNKTTTKPKTLNAVQLI